MADASGRIPIGRTNVTPNLENLPKTREGERNEGIKPAKIGLLLAMLTLIAGIGPVAVFGMSCGSAADLGTSFG